VALVWLPLSWLVAFGICASVSMVRLCLVPLCLAVPASTLAPFGETGIDPEQAALKRKPGKDFMPSFFLTGLMTVVLTYVLQAPALIANNMLVMNAQTRFSMASLLWIYLLSSSPPRCRPYCNHAIALCIT